MNMKIDINFQEAFIGSYLKSLFEEYPRETYGLIKQFFNSSLYLMNCGVQDELLDMCKSLEEKEQKNPIGNQTHIDIKLTYFTGENFVNASIYVDEILYKKERGFSSSLDAIEWADNYIKENMQESE